jgi:hypothetical protein
VLYSGGVAFVAKLVHFHFDAADPACDEIVNGATNAAVHLDEKIRSSRSDRKPSALERVAIQRSVSSHSETDPELRSFRDALFKRNPRRNLCLRKQSHAITKDHELIGWATPLIILAVLSYRGDHLCATPNSCDFCQNYSAKEQD